MITNTQPQNLRLYSSFVFIAALLAVFFLSLNPIDESDVFYHLKTGELIWSTGELPDKDVFSSSAFGAPWVLHEWLAEIVFYGVYVALGFSGLILFTSSLAVFAYFLAWRISRDHGAQTHLSLFAALLVGYFTFGLWVPRPHVFAYVFFVLLIFLLERYRRNGKTSYLWPIPVLLLFWANMHASFILGLAIISGYVVLFFVDRIRPEWRVGGGGGGARRSLLVFLASFAVSFFNPATYHAHLYGITIRPVAQAMNVIEWKPITAFLEHFDIRILLCEMTVILFFALLVFGPKKRRDVFLIGMLSAFTVLPFLSVRHIGFWALGAAFIFPLAVSQWFSKKENEQTQNALRVIVVCGVVVFLAVGVVSAPRKVIDERKVPVRPADFLEREGVKGPFFNTYSEGGYLLWRFWPKEHVFIDGRSEVFFGTPVREFYAISRGERDWNEIVDKKYGFNSFFVGYQPPSRFRSAYPMVLKLIQENWPFVYWDDSTLIFVRNIPEHASVISEYAIQYIAPWRAPTSIPDEQVKPALVEVGRLLEASPDSVVLRRYANELLRRK
ncbi:MAG: hypothetical protein AAB495_04460 [Patescibacteria group bacterium]